MADRISQRRSHDDLQSLRAVKYAIVHCFQLTGYHDEKTRELELGQPVYSIATCLRLVRPMRRFAKRIHGVLNDDGTLTVGGFDVPVDLMNIPNIQMTFYCETEMSRNFR